jgi:hypothetical protein
MGQASPEGWRGSPGECQGRHEGLVCPVQYPLDCIEPNVDDRAIVRRYPAGMWPFIGPIPTYGIFYFGGIILHFIIGWRIAKHSGLKRRVWIVAGICYMLAMTVGAKILFDLSVSDLNL